MTESQAVYAVTTRLMYMNVYDVNGTIKTGWGLHGDTHSAELVMLQHLDTLRAAGYKNLSGAIVPVRVHADVSSQYPVQAFRLDGRGLVRTKLDTPHAPEPTPTAPEPPTTAPFEPAPPSPETATAIAAHTAHHHVPSFD